MNFRVLPQEVCALVSTLVGEKTGETIKEGDLQRACELLEKGIYGNGQLSREEADFVIRCISLCSRKLKNGS